MFTSKNIFKTLTLLLPILFFGLSLKADAALLEILPDTASYSVGDTFTTTVVVSSADQSINAMSGTIAFPKDKLEAVSISKTSSIVNLWSQEPTFSNFTGEVNFEGVVLNPGYIGLSGTIIKINFRVKSSGTASLVITDGSVLANDGQGTNVLKDLSGANYNLISNGQVPEGSIASPLPAPEATTPSVISGVPPAPQVISFTHPDPSAWYATSSASFDWGPLPKGVTSVRILLDRKAKSYPTKTYSPAIDSKEIIGLSDGVWYFHVQEKNKYGWGSISHFRVQIDTLPPAQAVIEAITLEDKTNPEPAFNVTSTDKTSGLDYFAVKVDGEDFYNVDALTLQNQPLVLKHQTPGKKILLVQAVDKAGNVSTAAKEFEVVAIDSPKFTQYPITSKTGEVLEFIGTTYPDSTVTVFIKNEEGGTKTQIVRSDPFGNFRLVWAGELKEGTYSLYAAVMDSRGATSGDSPSVNLKIERAPVISIGSISIDNAYLAIGLLVLLVVFLSGGIFGWIVFVKQEVNNYCKRKRL